MDRPKTPIVYGRKNFTPNQEHPLRMGENIFSFVAIWRTIFLLSNYAKNCQKVGKIKAFRDSDNGSNMEKNSRKYKIQTD